MLQAGPTSAERVRELSQREDAARAAVGAEEELATFAALRSLARAEARRINHLYYCIRLRCMVMTTRYEYLAGVESFKTTSRQHVPDRFLADQNDAAADAYSFSRYFGTRQQDCQYVI